ncbi:hypothetical protein [Nocardia tenerifensis]|uniref:hypothetical protein n=1 Tax=Nocardia tenerifensis TaxID=228006 RepID=UPI000300D77C|nr:hypothetical protein [Nocardia tenerifensis]
MNESKLPHRAISRRAFGASVIGAAAVYTMGRTAPTTSAGPASSPYRLVAQEMSRTAGREFFGVNGARIISAQNAAQWHARGFRDALAATGTGLLRVQGGTTSQWLDWRTGLFDEHEGGGFAGRNDGRTPLLLSDWAELVGHTGATPIFDLNVANSTLDDQLDMLRHAQQLGMPVRYVELGNELWMPMARYSEVYPTGADYARTMNEWITAIRREFPHARIGVAAADDSSVLGTALGDRFRAWNDQLYGTIRGADAVVIHPYWIVDPVTADVSSTASGGVVQWTQLAQRLLPKVPTGMEIWFTEYNQMGREDLPLLRNFPAPQQTWAVALSVASFTLRALLDPRVGMAVMHCALNGAPTATTGGGGTTNQPLHALISDGSGGSELFGRTALNWALTPLYRSLDDSTTVRALRLDPGIESPAALLVPAYTGLAEAFTGAELTSAAGDTVAVLINAADRPLRIALPPSLIGARQATTYTAAPTAAPAFVPGDTISEIRTVAADTIELPAYSETLIRSS